MQLHFSVLGLLGLVLYAGCIFHAIKTGRINYWLLILIFLPGLGASAYLLIGGGPEPRSRRGAAGGGAGRPARPQSRTAREHREPRDGRHRRQQAPPRRRAHEARPVEG